MEDILGKHLSPGDVGDWDRGVRVLVGEDEFRGAHRVHCWLSSLAHWAITSDYRTNSFVLEPRIDNERYVVTHHAVYLYPRCKCSVFIGSFSTLKMLDLARRRR